MKVYISTPISGRNIEQVKKEIKKVSEAISAEGHEPVSPLDKVKDYTLPWLDYITADLKILGGCDAVCFVDGWRESYGCRIEREAALKLDKKLLVYKDGRLLPKEA